MQHAHNPGDQTGESGSRHPLPRLRIGLIHQRYVPFGGAERYMDALVRALLEQGHEVHVFAHHWNRSAAERGVHLHPVPLLHGASWLKVLTFAWASARAVQRVRCDLVLSLERTLRQDVYRAAGGCHRAWLAQWKRHVGPWTRFLLALDPLHPVLLRLESRTFSPDRTRGIIALAHRGRDEILEHYRFPAERIEVIHLGVDLERFQPAPRPLPPRPVILLFVGSGWQRKGLEFAVRALARLPEATRLRVFGKGNVGRYRRLAGRLGCLARLEFAGISADMPRAYQAAHVFVHPAIYEPFGNVCLEAMACGLPLVTTRITGASEIVSPGVNGAIVDDPADISALAAAVEPFLDPIHRGQASRAARAAAEQLPFSLNVQRTLDFLRRIQADKPGLAA